MAEIFAGFKWIALLDDRELFIEGLMTTLEVAVLALASLAHIRYHFWDCRSIPQKMGTLR